MFLPRILGLKSKNSEIFCLGEETDHGGRVAGRCGVQEVQQAEVRPDHPGQGQEGEEVQQTEKQQEKKDRGSKLKILQRYIFLFIQIKCQGLALVS